MGTAADIVTPEESVIAAVWRRFFDCVFALSLLGALAPLVLTVALLIMVDSRGPAVFRQQRRGRGGKLFSIYKFRTMYCLEDGPEVTQAQRCDPRVTRVGQILRRTSLDELPQLVNVIRGEMALVGPRPHAVAHDQFYAAQIPQYEDRYRVRPGMTGWAQINGLRGQTPELSQMARRVEHDLWYVENRTFTLDLAIICKTPLALLGEAF